MNKLENFFNQHRSTIIIWLIGISVSLFFWMMHSKPDKFISDNDIVTWGDLEYHLLFYAPLIFCSYLTRKELFRSESQNEWGTQVNEKIEQTEKKLADLIEALEEQEQNTKKGQVHSTQDADWPTVSVNQKKFKNRNFTAFK